MAEHGVIDTNLFSFHLVSEDRDNAVSFVDFGPIQDNHIRDPNEMIWIDVYDHMFWMNYETYGIRFGDDNDNAYTFDPKRNFLTVFDSGTSTIYVPFSLWSNFINQFKSYSGIRFGTKGQFYTYRCKPEVMPILYLLVDGYWLELRPEDYLLDASDNGDGSVCIFSFTQNSDEFWLLGDVFYRGYYVTHDDTNAKIGLAPSSIS